MMLNSIIKKLEKLFFIDNPGELCRLPYSNHPKGCPMFGTRPECPPAAPRIENKYDLSKPCFFIIQPFAIMYHKAKMKQLHKNWTDRQCVNPLYWQNTVRKELKNQVEAFMFQTYGIDLWSENGIRAGYELIPEAMGLNVFETALYHGIQIERNPQGLIYKIAFVGILK